MKITTVNDEMILFDNGKAITFSHDQDCCESNYAQFEQLEELAVDYDFEEPLDFEFVNEYGFRFGNKDKVMFFVPCYSEQNGYYASDIDIYYGEECVISGDCEVVY